MSRTELVRWAAWAPGLETRASWLAWAREPRPLTGRGAPDARFLPALARRRCDDLSRMMLEVVHACCDGPLLREVACVFASRYGALATTVPLLENLAVDEPLSPARFSHSVHNTQAGLFSIWARNRRPSAALAARSETFACGFLESLCMLHREPGRPVLLVAGDQPVPGPLAPLADNAHGAYALALLLAPSGSAATLALRLEAATRGADPNGRPPALEFLRWWLSGEGTLRLPSAKRTWVWTREQRSVGVAHG